MRIIVGFIGVFIAVMVILGGFAIAVQAAIVLTTSGLSFAGVGLVALTVLVIMLGGMLGAWSLMGGA